MVVTAFVSPALLDSAMTNNGVVMKVSANGTTGHLLYTGDGRYIFRVYQDNFDFTDYDLHHSDLCVTITDEDATLYSDEHGYRLDHNPETLGKSGD
jgi:hypothetical protein